MPACLPTKGYEFPYSCHKKMKSLSLSILLHNLEKKDAFANLSFTRFDYMGANCSWQYRGDGLRGEVGDFTLSSPLLAPKISIFSFIYLFTKADKIVFFCATYQIIRKLNRPNYLFFENRYQVKTKLCLSLFHSYCNNSVIS